MVGHRIYGGTYSTDIPLGRWLVFMRLACDGAGLAGLCVNLGVRGRERHGCAVEVGETLSEDEIGGDLLKDPSLEMVGLNV